MKMVISIPAGTRTDFNHPAVVDDTTAWCSFVMAKITGLEPTCLPHSVETGLSETLDWTEKAVSKERNR